MDSAGRIVTLEHTLDLVDAIFRQMLHEIGDPADLGATMVVASKKVLTEARNIEPRDGLAYNLQAEAVRESEKHISQIIERALIELREVRSRSA